MFGKMMWCNFGFFANAVLWRLEQNKMDDIIYPATICGLVLMSAILNEIKEYYENKT